MGKFRAIEVYFPEPVDLSSQDQQELVGIISRVCDQWSAEHPGRTMWPFGIGCKPTFIPLTSEQEQERGIEFDESTFQIECYERADYEWKCTKCGKPQGDHKGHITEPPAGDCDFAASH